MTDALVVNIFGPPGVGKSTIASLLFGELKLRQFEIEQAHEWAKEPTWEGRHGVLNFQPYTTAKQMWRIHRLLDKVDIVLTDSPILLGLIYVGAGYDQPAFDEFVLGTHRMWDTLNFFLRPAPDAPYRTAGRRQTEQEAQKIGQDIETLLWSSEIPYIPVTAGRESVPIMADLIEGHVATR